MRAPEPAAARADRADPTPSGPGFWIAAALGIGIMAFGGRGILTHARGTHPPAFAAWLVGADVVHDLLLAPAVLLVGALLARTVPHRWWPPVRAGAMATAVVLAVAWAPLRGYGRATAVGNETVQPLDYSTAVLTVLAVVWSGVGLWLGARWWRRTR
jgi:hypothetical protein